MQICRNENDPELIIRIQRGDHAAFGVLVQRHTDRFFRFAWRMLGNESDAEDVVQDAFVKFWENPHTWDAGKNVQFTTWFTRIIHNRCIDFLRRKKPITGTDVLDFRATDETAADDTIDKKEVQIVLEAGIHNLPERQKSALTLCFYEGLSNKEAASVMGIGVKALESLIMRAKKALRIHFEDNNLIEDTSYDKAS